MDVYSVEALEMLLFAALFSVASLVTIKGNPWISMMMSTTSILLIGTLYLAVG